MSDPCALQVARWSRLWRFIHEADRGTCTDIILDQDLDPASDLDPRVNKFLMDRCILKVHLPNGGFNMVKYGDATDVKVREHTVFCCRFLLLFFFWQGGGGGGGGGCGVVTPMFSFLSVISCSHLQFHKFFLLYYLAYTDL